jgi:hypothetical protein
MTKTMNIIASLSFLFLINLGALMHIAPNVQVYDETEVSW